jgi:hypothetical protein
MESTVARGYRKIEETEGRTPHKAKGQQRAGGDGFLLAVTQFGRLGRQPKSSVNASPVEQCCAHTGLCFLDEHQEIH